jgi:hypothetical protein
MQAERHVAAADKVIATTKAEMPEPRPTTLVIRGEMLLPLDSLATLQGITTVIRLGRLTIDFTKLSISPRYLQGGVGSRKERSSGSESPRSPKHTSCLRMGVTLVTSHPVITPDSARRSNFASLPWIVTNFSRCK